MDSRPLENFTLIVPFYRNSAMLERHVQEWRGYPATGVEIIVVDDGSPEEAAPILRRAMFAQGDWLGPKVRLYRITVDIPWNREGARNLGAHEASTNWIVHVDIDHILPSLACMIMLGATVSEHHWYRFHRSRVGAADETRRKDKIPREWDGGPIHPHVDSYLVTRAAYWSIGGYDEDYSGVLGGGSQFLRRLEARLGPPMMLGQPIGLQVHTRHSVPDASVSSLSRDTTPGKEIERRKRAAGRMIPGKPLRFPWVRIL